MVIFNGREMSSKFVRNVRIVEINSPIKDIAEAIDVMREAIKSGADLSDFYISSYRYSDDDFTPITKGTPEWRGTRNVFDEILTEGVYESLSDTAAVYRRPSEFVNYEKFQFNQTTGLRFKSEEICKEDALHELMAGYGILPTLWDEEHSVAELKSLSKAGENLVRMFDGENYAVSMFNAPPPLTWIVAYQELSPYEKRAIVNGRMHPAKAMQIARGIKEYAKDMLFRQEMVDYIIENTSDEKRITSKDAIAEFTTGFANKEGVKDMLNMAEEVFKAKFHGRSPRVLSEYMEGTLASRGVDPSTATREIVEEIAGKFTQTNVSRVAKYRNPVLLALSEKVSFANQKDNVLQAIGVNFHTSSLKSLFDKGFPEWLDNHPNVKPEEVSKIYSILSQIRKIDIDESAKDIIAKIELKKGYVDARLYEEKEIYAAAGYKFANNEIAIRGRNIVAKQGNLTMRMLSADDYRNFIVGYDTHCCQHFGDAGESCVYKYTSDPFAACVVIERGDKVVAQGFVWTDEVNDTFVFDNVELDNDRDVQQFSDLFAAYAEALPYANVHVGTGYNQGMNGWGQKVGFDKQNKIIAKMPTTIDGRTNITGWGDGNCYSDYHVEGGSIARAIKHMGSLKLEKRGDVRIEMRPDEPTRWDELAKPDLNFMLNDYAHTPEERIAIAKEFRENPSEESQMNIIKSHPQAIASIDNPCHAAQLYIMEHNKDLIWRIKNPCEEVKIKMVEEDPSFLGIIENPSDELVCSALSRDGTLLAIINNPSEDACIIAVRQNGYAIKNVPLDKRTERVQLAAVESEPKAISIINNPVENVEISAVSVKPEVIALIPSSSMNAQLAAVRLRPSVINMIKEPYPEAITAAVRHNGLLIRNFQDTHPELRLDAVRQNGFAIGCLKNPTVEEARIALEQNPCAISVIHDEGLISDLRNEVQDYNIDDIEIA